LEWFWLVVAAIGAGVGTGLAGLSAATLMVPILIVLCPSFEGEKGTYQATAIALASDILGSAVATRTYAKHKNIDLKRGWVVMACILIMCVVGSYVAFLIGNFTLGSMTLFITFFIGIRFIIKPETKRKDNVGKGTGLTGKEVLISVICGTCIGFGTGFIGSGGGMTMLIVFTLLLGMDIKTAVGTSTFIMTFTALTASVCHIIIHPAIIMEKWLMMIVCMAVATVASLISARFANRVSNKVVGRVNGVLLTVLGAFLIILKFWDYIIQIPFLSKWLGK